MNQPRPHLSIFDNTYVRDLEGFYVSWTASPASQPTLICLNERLATELGVDPLGLKSPDGISVLAGNLLPQGAEPIAQAYAGHQFGGFSPQLGDGRALLIGEILDAGGVRRDVVLKGAGRTPFSRNGDGKYALGPALREHLISEAIHALDIPTTRSLAVVATGDLIRRERALPGAVLTRIASSHLRIGTFEYAAAHQGPQQVQRLADYAIARHYPELKHSTQPYLDFLSAVCDKQAALIAQWMGIGFIHGVMNTDNMTISGETIDYGPCAFMEAYDPATVFSSIDHQGRYAYGRQSHIAQWNLARLAETLLPLIDDQEKAAFSKASQTITHFEACFQNHWLNVMRAKLGIDATGNRQSDHRLAERFLNHLFEAKLDFTVSFRALYELAAGNHSASVFPEITQNREMAGWLDDWHRRQPQRTPKLLSAMGKANPWIIPRNHQVEKALNAAVEGNDPEPLNTLLDLLRHPSDAPNQANIHAMSYAEPAPPEITARYRTFCGT